MGRLTLRVKFTIIAASIALGSLLILGYLSSQALNEQFERDEQEAASLILTHVVDDLEQGMLFVSHAFIAATLDLYRARQGVKELRIFDPKGREVFSQAKGPPVAGMWEVLKGKGSTHFRQTIDHTPVDTYIVRIKDRPACHRCHTEDAGLRGALLLSLSREAEEQEQARQKRDFLILFALVALGSSGATVLTVGWLFLRPLRRIYAGTEAIASGNYRYQIPVKTKDEIGSLAENFNRMAEALLQKHQELSSQLELVSRSQREWQQTVDCITDAIAVLDRECTVIRANRVFKEQFGEFLSGLSIGMNGPKCHELLGACPVSNCPNIISLRNRKPVIKEVQGPTPEKILQASIFPYESPEGEVIGSVAVFRDITEQKETEFQLIMNERFAALGQMAAGIAHEINNPLATVAAAAEGLLQRLEKDELDRGLFETYLKIIREEMLRCGSVTRSMSPSLRKDDGKGGINIVDVIEKVVEIANFMGKMKEVEVLRNYQEGMPLIPGDEADLRQVALAIIGNALDAMEEKGKLTLETGTDGDKAFIKIIDTGPGIPQETLSQIFQPFFTTKFGKGGTGLGLPIARKIVKKNKGEIEVTSEEGKGTAVKITLPL